MLSLNKIIANYDEIHGIGVYRTEYRGIQMKVTYHQEWTVPRPLSEVWNFFQESLQDSRKLSAWPHSVSDLRVLGRNSPNATKSKTKVKPGSKIEATYKLGPLKTKATYTLQSITPEQELVYNTTPNHPLIGQSKITLTKGKKGTRCVWSGTYESKNFSSVGSLLWFKLFFERTFFSQLKKKMKPLQ